jgi:hypothetical protein
MCSIVVDSDDSNSDGSDSSSATEETGIPAAEASASEIIAPPDKGAASPDSAQQAQQSLGVEAMDTKKGAIRTDLTRTSLVLLAYDNRCRQCE